MNLSLFDLHCDTAWEMLKQKQPLEENGLAVSLQKASIYHRYAQVMAHWTPSRMQDEEGWQNFLAMHQNLLNDPAVRTHKAKICTSCPDKDHIPSLFLAVEDARILAGKIDRVDRLFAMGIRILTPLWKGETCIGGSHDTDRGLTSFGKEALDRAASLGMILDISHASIRSAEMIFSIAQAHHRPVIASHSNAYDVCPVSRNLRTEQIQYIVDSDGLIGINLFTDFVTADGKATSIDALRHIDRFLELGAKDRIALGCDMDGCKLPPDIPNVSALVRLAEQMQKSGYSEELIHNLFYGNAYRFAKQYFRT